MRPAASTTAGVKRKKREAGDDEAGGAMSDSPRVGPRLRISRSLFKSLLVLKPLLDFQVPPVEIALAGGVQARARVTGRQGQRPRQENRQRAFLANPEHPVRNFSC